MKTCLVIVDPQKDFCHPAGSLFVTGADQDALRMGAMIDRVRSKLDSILVTLDSHHRLHIANPFSGKTRQVIPHRLSPLSQKRIFAMGSGCRLTLP